MSHVIRRPGKIRVSKNSRVIFMSECIAGVRGCSMHEVLGSIPSTKRGCGLSKASKRGLIKMKVRWIEDEEKDLIFVAPWAELRFAVRKDVSQHFCC